MCCNRLRKRLQNAFPTAAEIGRIGGDEFALTLYTTSPDLLEERCRRFIRMLGDICWQGSEVGAQCSAGFCRIGAPDFPYERVYREVDRALYEAKREGKGPLPRLRDQLMDHARETCLQRYFLIGRHAFAHGSG